MEGRGFVDPCVMVPGNSRHSIPFRRSMIHGSAKRRAGRRAPRSAAQDSRPAEEARRSQLVEPSRVWRAPTPSWFPNAEPSLLARATRELVPEHGTSSSLARATRDLVPQDSARLARYSARYCGDTIVEVVEQLAAADVVAVPLPYSNSISQTTVQSGWYSRMWLEVPITWIVLPFGNRAASPFVSA